MQDHILCEPEEWISALHTLLKNYGNLPASTPMSYIISMLDISDTEIAHCTVNLIEALEAQFEPAT